MHIARAAKVQTNGQSNIMFMTYEINRRAINYSIKRYHVTFVEALVA